MFGSNDKTGILGSSEYFCFLQIFWQKQAIHCYSVFLEDREQKLLKYDCNVYVVLSAIFVGPRRTNNKAICNTFSSPELRPFWPAPRIESSDRGQDNAQEQELPIFLTNGNRYSSKCLRLRTEPEVRDSRTSCFGPCQSSRSMALVKRIASLGREPIA